MEKEIFDLLKEKKYNKLIDYIKNLDNDTNLNIKDEFQNYLIENVINTNNIELLEEVLKKKVVLDILDNNGTGLLYRIIKFNNIDGLKLLLDANKVNIGFNIFDKQDITGRTPLHYSIHFNNYQVFKILLDHGADPYFENKKGDNSFFYCLKYKRNDMLIELLKKFKRYNMTNKKTENLLMVAILYENYEIVDYLLDLNINIDYKTKTYGMNVLNYLIVVNKKKYIMKLLNKGLKINNYDKFGNSCFHFCIMNSNYDLLDYFYDVNSKVDDKVNFNLTNYDGFTALHMLLNDKTSPEHILKKFVIKTNLNIQDNNGESCLLLLIKNNLFSKFKDILEKKKLNVFIENVNDDSPYKLLKDDQIKVIINSFYNMIKKESSKLTLNWEKQCVKSDVIIREGVKNKEKCVDKIEHVIKTENRSIPQIQNINLDMESGILISDCFFSGEIIDTLFGMLWLKNKFNNVNKINLNFVLSYPYSNNKKLKEHYENMGINYRDSLDFNNIKIFWSYQNIIIPDYYESKIKEIIKNKDKNKNNIIIIPIGIDTASGGHSNILFWDVDKGIIERFEPNGANEPLSFHYNHKLLDSILVSFFKRIDKDIKYITPENYLPIIGFQQIENIESKRCKNEAIGDPNGFCSVWCIWYVYQRLLNINHDEETRKIVLRMINNLKLNNTSFRKLIRNFSKNISSLRDEYLRKVKLDINDWISMNYSEEEFNKLEQNIYNGFS